MTEFEKRGDRVAGAALLVAAFATVLAMAHHPTSAHAGAIGPIVHATMIALLALATFAFAHFSIRRGLGRPAILAGLVAYVVSLLGHVGAATISGFIVPALAARGHAAVGHDILLLAWESNQALASLGLVATGAAFILWSFDFLGRGGAEPRAIGLAGLVAGALPALLLVGGWLRLDVAGAFIAYAVHAAWMALVGLHLLRGRLESGANDPATA